MHLPTVQHLYQRIETILNQPRWFAGLVVLLLAVKLLCMGLFSSDYQTAMFEPFLEEFLDGWADGCFNPYQHYYENRMEMNFPYPPVMLLIMSVGRGLCMLLPDVPLVLHNILFKLPLLAMDCLVFVLLCRMYPDKRVTAALVYFASPLTLYATFMHTQLDIIPMAFLFLSMVGLTKVHTKRRFCLSAFFMALALLSKFHIAAILPLVAIYIYKHFGLAKTTSYFAVIAGVVFACLMPFYGQGFIEGVVLNSAQSALFTLYFSYGDLKLYVALIAAALVYLYTMNLNFINSDLLYGMGGLIFTIFLALCAPMPGWYMWVIIFLADFILRSNGYKHTMLCYGMLQLLYLLYFVCFHRTEDNVTDLYFLTTDCSFLKIDIPQLRSIVFTMLTSKLLYMMYLMHKFCIAGNSMYAFHNQSFVIGICGDSGTGKSTLQDSVSRMFSPKNFLRIEGDGDHKWERGDRNWENYTHLNPQANYLYRQAMDIRRLKNGESVKRVEYDHNTGHFTQKKTVYPCRFMSISGLHIFYLPQLRSNVDLKIYTEADEDLRLLWKMGRDTAQRGHTREEILRQIQSRYEDARRYVYPQKEFADIVIRYFLDDPETQSVGMELKISTMIDMEGVISALREAGAEISYEFSEDFRHQIVEFRPSQNASLETEEIEQRFDEIFEHGYDILSETFEAEDVSDGVRKLVLVQAIRSKLRGEI